MSFLKRAQRDDQGFTLLELLVAIFLAMVVMSAGYTVFQGSNRAAMQQNMDNRMQDNARVAMDVIARSIRRSGYLVNFTSYDVGWGIDDAFGSSYKVKLLVQNSNSAADRLTVVGGTLISVGTLVRSAPRGGNTLILTDAAGIRAGDIIGVGLTFSGRVSAPPAGNVVTLDTTIPTGALNMDYPGEFLADGVTLSNQHRTPVRILTGTLYEINSVTDPRHPVLQQVTRGNTEPVAEDIEDLQFAYGVDRNANRIIESDEWTWNPTAAELDRIRLVRITIVARSAQPDPAWVNRAQTVPAIEDRPARPNLVDGFRRYILTRVVKARNIDVLFTL